MVDGSVGLIVAPRGRLFRVLRFTFANGYIAGMEVIGDPDLSIDEGAVSPWSGARGEYFGRVLAAVAETYGFKTSTPWKKLKKADQKVILYGSGTRQIHVQYRNRYGRTRSYNTHYEGVIPYLKRRHTEAESDRARESIEGYMREVPCPVCGGARLKPESLAVTVDGRNIFELCDLPLRDATGIMMALELSERDLHTRFDQSQPAWTSLEGSYGVR